MTDEERIAIMISGLQKIAHGRTDCGRPLAGETSREFARRTLIRCGVAVWSPNTTVQPQPKEPS